MGLGQGLDEPVNNAEFDHMGLEFGLNLNFEDQMVGLGRGGEKLEIRLKLSFSLGFRLLS